MPLAYSPLPSVPLESLAPPRRDVRIAACSLAPPAFEAHQAHCAHQPLPGFLPCSRRQAASTRGIQTKYPGGQVVPPSSRRQAPSTRGGGGGGSTPLEDLPLRVHGSMIGNACFADPSIARSCHSCTYVPILGSCVEAGVFCGFYFRRRRWFFRPEFALHTGSTSGAFLASRSPPRDWAPRQTTSPLKP